jgi:uncharacterized membrane protein
MSNRSWLIAALIASLGINLALGGYLLGRLSGARPAAVDPMLSALRMVRDLPDERRRALRPLLREPFRAMRPDVRRMWAAQTRINAALTAEPFDPDALDAALADFRDALLASQRSSHPGLVRLAGAMTAAERLTLRDAMGSPPQRHGRHDDRQPREHGVPSELRPPR